MPAFMRYARLAAVAALIGLVGCGSTSARSPGEAQSPAPASVVRQVSANTFTVTKPDGKTFTVTGVRPVSVPGPWVITKIA